MLPRQKHLQSDLFPLFESEKIVSDELLSDLLSQPHLNIYVQTVVDLICLSGVVNFLRDRDLSWRKEANKTQACVCENIQKITHSARVAAFLFEISIEMALMW